MKLTFCHIRVLQYLTLCLHILTLVHQLVVKLAESLTCFNQSSFRFAADFVFSLCNVRVEWEHSDMLNRKKFKLT